MFVTRNASLAGNLIDDQFLYQTGRISIRPLFSGQLKSGAANGKITADDLIGKSKEGPWSKATSVSGLGIEPPDSETDDADALSEDDIMNLLGSYEAPTDEGGDEDADLVGDLRAVHEGDPPKTDVGFTKNSQSPAFLPFESDNVFVDSDVLRVANTSYRISEISSVEKIEIVPRPIKKIAGTIMLAICGFFLLGSISSAFDYVKARQSYRDFEAHNYTRDTSSPSAALEGHWRAVYIPKDGGPAEEIVFQSANSNDGNTDHRVAFVRSSGKVQKFGYVFVEEDTVKRTVIYKKGNILNFRFMPSAVINSPRTILPMMSGCCLTGESKRYFLIMCRK
jgi:hypothetical protein